MRDIRAVLVHLLALGARPDAANPIITVRLYPRLVDCGSQSSLARKIMMFRLYKKKSAQPKGRNGLNLWFVILQHNKNKKNSGERKAVNRKPGQLQLFNQVQKGYDCNHSNDKRSGKSNQK